MASVGSGVSCVCVVAGCTWSSCCFFSLWDGGAVVDSSWELLPASLPSILILTLFVQVSMWFAVFVNRVVIKSTTGRPGRV